MRRVLSGLILACICMCVMAGPAAGKLVNRIVAVVNGEIITLHELQTEIQGGVPGMDSEGPENQKQAQAKRRRVLEAMINDTLLKQQAERFEIQVSDAEIDNQIQQIQDENDLSQDEFEQAVREQGMDMDQYRQALREEIKKNRVLSNMVRQKVVVAEDEMRAYYQEHKEDYKQPKQVHLGIIVHPSKSRLEKVRQSIVSEETRFAEAADSVSQGPGADQGGDLGRYAWKDLKPKWREILKSLEPGELSPVFTLQGNYALLYLKQFTDKKVQPFEAVKDKIRQQLYAQKLEERYKEFMQGLRDKAVVNIRLGDAQ
ncbi:MAG: SurA N-terminal domain-containing protein [Desulfovermiculus sp.]